MISPVHVHRIWNVAMVSIVLMATILTAYAYWGLPDSYLGTGGQSVFSSFFHRGPEELRIEDFVPSDIETLTPDQAVAANIASPLERKNPLASPFHPEWLTESELNQASDCMTQAIYYEAASEPFAGQLAVAQVILNRTRHPRFPKTVCGVVNQGSERQTGCQFTYTCDGSLNRVPSASGMARARSVAQAALHGMVSPLAGQATHYHTIWIVPVWAKEMRKVGIMGHHVFYRPPAAYADYPPRPAVLQAAADLATPTSLNAALALAQPTVSAAAEARAEAKATPETSSAAPAGPVVATNDNAQPHASGDQPAPGKHEAEATPAKPRSFFGSERRRQGSLPLAR